MTKADIVLKSGDTRPAVKIQVIDEDGDPVDLSGATARFQMKHINDDTLTLDAQAIIESPTEEGRLAYTWGDDDVTEPGTYQAEFAIDYDGYVGESFDADETVPANEKRTYIEIEVVETLP